MLSYSNIVKKAFHITTHYPLLWFFGLFVAGGFNLNFLRFQNIPANKIRSGLKVHEAFVFLAGHPGTLAVLSASILILALFSLFITNWSRIMLVLLSDSIIKTRALELPKEWKKSQGFLWPVIRMSVLTAALMVFSAAALFVPAYFLVSDPSIQALLLTGAVVIFLPLAFTISCINIFTSFYIVLFKQSLGAALNLGTDFFVSRWSQILGLTAVLMVIYFVSFIVGVSLITLTQELLRVLFEFFLRFNISAVSATIIALRFAATVVFWLILAGLNVFINTALLLFFLELNTPVKSEEGLEAAKEVLAPVPTV